MGPSLTIALAILTILYGGYYCISQRWKRWVFTRKHGCQPPPSLSQRDPLFGLDLIFLWLRSLEDHQHNLSLQAQFEAYGNTFTSKPYGKTKVFTSEPDNVQVILAKDFRSWGVQPMRLFAFESFAGEGILNIDGALWERSRALVRPAFARVQIADLSGFAIHVRRSLEIVPKDGSTVDLQPLFSRLALDSATE